MNLIDKVILEWSYRTKKGYPDINNEEDMRVFESLFKFSINEGNLSWNDLVKPFPPRHEFQGKYKDRGERFLEKIEIGAPFDLPGDTSVIIDKDKSTKAIEALKNKDYEAFKGATSIKFITQDGKSLTLSKFLKTAEFGSGGGQGGGSKNTRIQESAMAVVCAIALNKGGVQDNDINDKEISNAMSKVDIDATKEEVTEFINVQKTWKDTFIGSANTFLRAYNNPNFTFHRGSDFTNSIYKAYSIAKKEAEVNMNNDKWNPADIWAVDSSILGMTFPTKLEELNGVLATLLADKKLIGISLKKATASPKLTVVNLDRSDYDGYTYDEFIMRATNNNLMVKYSGGQITFRTFRFATNYAGQIDGKHASHGKIGVGPLNTTLRLNGLSGLPVTKDVASKFTSQDKEFTREYKNLFIKYIENSSDEVFDKAQEKDLNYQVSKYMSLKLLDIIEQADKKVQDEFISDVIRYASSMSKVSSVHVKIS